MDDKTLETPDLSKGVPSSSIAEGGMVVGRVGDEAVLIARGARRCMPSVPNVPAIMGHWPKG
jgi:hypothetical protein